MKKCIKPFFAILVTTILLINIVTLTLSSVDPPFPPTPPCPIYTIGGRLVDDCEEEYCEF